MTNDKDESRRAKVVTWGALIASGTIAVTIVGGAMGILNWLYSENNRLRSEISSVQIEFLRNQVTKPEFKAGLQELSDRFERGFDRLEKRIDGRTK